MSKIVNIDESGIYIYIPDSSILTIFDNFFIYIYVKVELAIEDGLPIEGEVPSGILSIRQ